MSELAPFVAAALRDKVVLDMLHEVEELKRQLSRARRVTIQGRSGVWAEAQLEDGHTMDPTRWNVDFPENSSYIGDIRLAELKVGGLVHSDLFTSARETFPEDYAEETKRMEVTVYYGEMCITFEVGEVEKEFYSAMLEVDPEQALEEMVKVLSMRRPPVKVYWKSVNFTGGSAKEAVRDIFPSWSG